MASVAARRSVITGSLQKYLASQRSSLVKSPLLVVSSQPGLDDVPRVKEACEFASFTTSQALSLRTVPLSLESAFPTDRDVHQGMELVQRTGAGAILGVGSGAAMDLAKAVAQQSNTQNLILAPSTLGATLAAGASHSLLLDTNEEAVAVYEPTTSADLNQETTVILDQNTMYTANESDDPARASPTLVHAAYASLAIGLDAMYTSGDITTMDHVETCLRSSIAALEDQDASGNVVTGLYRAGLLLRYGIPSSDTNFQRRSIVLALACSILPMAFPQCHMVTFMASILPGLHQTLQSRATPQTNETVQNLSSRAKAMLDGAPSLSSLSVDSTIAHPVPTLMKHLHNNQALWECHDAQNNVLEEVLHRSLNR